MPLIINRMFSLCCSLRWIESTNVTHTDSYVLLHLVTINFTTNIKHAWIAEVSNDQFHKWPKHCNYHELYHDRDENPYECG